MLGPRRKAASPPRRASASLARRFALPARVPAATAPAAPRVHERIATIHLPTTTRIALAPRGPVAVPKSGIDPRQMAALDARFRTTIAQAQRAVEAPPAAAPVRPNDTERPVNTYLNVSMNEVIDFTGGCTPYGYDDEGQRRGRYTYYFVRCIITYSDGYVETVAFPWQWKWTDADNPFLPGGPEHFPGQPPPPGFTLPHPFAMSRAVCAFFRAQCQAVLDQERARGLTSGT